MRIVPVIDILAGRVVRGVAGRREQYRPVESRLCAGSEALDVVAAFMDLFPFDAVYMADLDAIEHGRDNARLVESLLLRHPSLDVWVDAGFRDAHGLARWRGVPRVRPVLGSESQVSAEACADLLATTGGRALLSLDFRAGAFLGPPALRESVAGWPREVVAMTLDAVGMDGGPGVGPLDEVLGRAGPARAVYAAGGLRGVADARALAAMGCAGVLVASALHSGVLGRAELEDLARS